MRRERIGIAAIIVAAMLAFATAAKAAPFTPSLERAYNVATQYWGDEPSGCTSIEKAIVPRSQLGVGYEAEATIPLPGEHIPCAVWVAKSLAPPRSFGPACGILTHEVGHLHGLTHSEDPKNVMFPDLVRLPSICWRAIERRMR